MRESIALQSPCEKQEEKPVVTKRDVLLRAADLLEEFGWCQNSPAKDENGSGLFDPYPDWERPASFCLSGAVERAVFDLTGQRPRYDGWPKWFRLSSETSGVLKRHGIGPGQNVIWNNAPERTKEEVVALLREMAEVA